MMKPFGKIFYFLATLCLSQHALAVLPGGISFKADKYTSNIQTGITRGTGSVQIKVDGKEIESDEVEIDSTKGLIKGKGHIKFVSDNVSILADEISFEIKSGLGEFKAAVLKKENEFHIEARQLSRVGDFRYQGKEVKVSSCLDCPQAWSVTGSFADVEVEGYVEIHHALLQIKDAPILYFPVFVYPIKTKRQSGFLAPQLFNKHPDLGFRFRVPYYWASRADMDSTWNYQFATEGGHRLNTEFRYQYSDRSYASGNVSAGRNQSVASVPQDRFGYSFSERYQINSHWTQRLRGELGSDTRYSSHYSDEFTGSLQPYLINEPSLTYQDPQNFSYALLRFHKDNVIRGSESVPGLDRLPELGFQRPLERIWGPFFGDLDAHLVSFRRRGLSLDSDSGWIREGDRLSVQGRLLLSSNFYSVMNYSPELFLRLDAYQFQPYGLETYPNAYRARVMFSQQISSEIFRVFSTADSGDLKAVKHSFVPRIGLSFAPPELKTSSHKFFSSPNSPRFDLFDPDSPDAQQITLGTVTAEQKLRKHYLLTVGFDTRVVGRFGDTQKKYEEFFVAKVDQDFDMANYPDLEGQRTNRLSPLKVSATAQYSGFKGQTNMAIDFGDDGNVDIVSDLSYAWSLYRLSIRQTNLKSAKTAGASFSIRNYGPWTISLSGDMDLITQKTTRQAYSLAYSSPSKCWDFVLQLSKEPNQADPDKFNINPMINPVIGAGIRGKFL